MYLWHKLTLFVAQSKAYFHPFSFHCLLPFFFFFVFCSCCWCWCQTPLRKDELLIKRDSLFFPVNIKLSSAVIMTGLTSFTRSILDMSAESVGLLALSLDQSNSPLSNDQIIDDDDLSTVQISFDQTMLSLRSPGKRPLTIEESLTRTNDTKRLCNR